MTSRTHEALAAHLLRADGQEDLCFVRWQPSTGHRRGTALLGDPIWPADGERNLHGNVSFEGDYFLRAAAEAAQSECGIALLHSHPGASGWQGMSPDDHAAEAGHAGQALSMTGLPMLGLTLAGGDQRWSARFWGRTRPRVWEPRWADTVRVVGGQFRPSYNPAKRPVSTSSDALVRTISAWGPEIQNDLERIHVGVVGAGSVGAIVAEGLTRMGVADITIFDFDVVEEHNRDRLLHAGPKDVGRPKAHLLADALSDSATATDPRIGAVTLSICEPEGLAVALDCDVLFSCVDRPWPRAVLNMAALAHFIPVVDGGVMVDPGRRVMRGAEWRAHIAAPGRRCLECLGQYQPGMVQVERDGLLDDPTYLASLPPEHVVKRRENVFAFSAAAASAQLLQFLSMVVAPAGVSDVRAQLFHFATGRMDIDESDCEPNCLYQHTLAGTGDRAPTVTASHPLAEKMRRSHPAHADIVDLDDRAEARGTMHDLLDRLRKIGARAFRPAASQTRRHSVSDPQHMEK